MYAERSSIQYLDLTNNNHSTQIDGLRGAVAVAYDMREEYIFWADMKDHMIFRRKFNGTGKIFEIFVLKGIPLSKCLRTQTSFPMYAFFTRKLTKNKTPAQTWGRQDTWKISRAITVVNVSIQGVPSRFLYS